MNYRMVGYILLWVIKLEGLFLLLPVFIGLIYREYEQAVIFLICAAIYCVLGFIGTFFKPKNTRIFQKEGFVAVALCWIVISVFGALPFVFTGEIPNFVDALFEIVSGFTTTGSSILTDVETISHVCLFWRSFSHWLGGMGVLVFALMLLPAKDGSHMYLMKAESPGPDVSKFVPRVRDTAIILYKIYIFLTIIEIAILLFSGMHWFDTLCISFGTAGTGGFSILASGCATYTALQQWVITIFMILFGVNFSFYYFILCKKAGLALKMEEVRTYIIIILAAIAVISVNILSIYENIGEAVRHAAFQVGSIITTTGYATTDFNLWPALSKTILVVLMFVGACAGSTGGGLKVSRIVIMMRTVKREVYRTINPRRVKTVQMDGKAVSDAQRHSVSVYISAYFLVFFISFIIVSIDGFSMESNFTAVASAINNIGPGLDMVGPMGSFASYGIISKLVLTFDMLAGRLEILPMFILMSPSLWKRRS